MTDKQRLELLRKGMDELKLTIYSPPGGSGSLDAFPDRVSYRNWSVWDAGELF